MRSVASSGPPGLNPERMAGILGKKRSRLRDGWLHLLAGDPSDRLRTVIGTGYLGSLTTFSMFALEATEGAPKRRITIISATLIFGLLAATAGHALG